MRINTRVLGALAIFIATTCCGADAGSAYLRPHEKIIWVGDSITAQDLYEPYVLSVLRAIYPDVDFGGVNAGVGGATAPARYGGIPELVEREHPTLMTVMFGVNDTGWSLGSEPQKIDAYAAGLRRYVDLAKQKKLDLLFLHETHFSHNAKAQPLEIGLDALLAKLFAEEDRVASAGSVGVIDAYGAYVRALNLAWEVDPKYEFTPNFVHPTMLGHAAVAGEILKALGAGLPLAGEQRGALHMSLEQSVQLSAEPRSGMIDADGKLSIAVQAISEVDRPIHGDVIAVVAGRKFVLPMALDARGSGQGTIQLPGGAMGRRWEVQPIYLAFIGDGIFAAGETPLYYSHLIPATAAHPFTRDDKGWVKWEGVDPAASTVSDIRAMAAPQSLRVEFFWKDTTPVAARNTPYQSRLGEPVTTPLDATAPVGQPCDAVEILLDLRDEKSSGRYTSNMDSNPQGTARVGLYRIEENGKLVCRLQVTPPALADSFKLIELGADRFAIEWTGKAPASGVGLDLFVTDAATYAPNKTVGAYLTSVPRVGTDWMDFFRLSAGKAGTFYRIGY